MSHFVTNMTYAYISAINKDNDKKLSAYDPWGLPNTSIMSCMTLSFMSLVRNHQHPPSTPLPDTLTMKIYINKLGTGYDQPRS